MTAVFDTFCYERDDITIVLGSSPNLKRYTRFSQRHLISCRKNVRTIEWCRFVESPYLIIRVNMCTILDINAKLSGVGPLDPEQKKGLNFLIYCSARLRVQTTVESWNSTWTDALILDYNPKHRVVIRPSDRICSWNTCIRRTQRMCAMGVL